MTHQPGVARRGKSPQRATPGFLFRALFARPARSSSPTPRRLPLPFRPSSFSSTSFLLLFAPCHNGAMLLRADRRVVFGVPGLLALGLAAGLIWRAVGGSYEQQLYVRTLALALQAAAGALPIALLLAWILLRTQVPLARGLIVLLLGQLLMPLYLHAAAW